ncbi:MAG: hypothetical protein PGN13_11370 [Patulibacter minatonensis]
MDRRTPLFTLLVALIAAVTFILIRLAKGDDLDLGLILVTAAAAAVGWLIGVPGMRRRRRRAE